MTAGRQRTMAPQSDTDIRVIIQEAQHRWLRPQEVCEILRNYKRHNFRLNNIPPQTPQSGSLFLFDRKTLRYFRKDGHNWRKKKDGKTVREAHERLKAGSIDVLHCYYAHGEDNHNFQRRAYWMLDPAYEHIVLVHYREVSETNRLCRMPDPVDRPVASNPLLHSQQQAPFGQSAMSSMGSMGSMGVANSMPSPETMDMVGTSHSPELEEVESAEPDELDDAVADVIGDQSVPQLSLSEQLTDPQHLPPLGRQTSADPWETGFSRMNSGNVNDAANSSRYMSQGDFKPSFPTVAPLSNYPTFRASGGSHMNPLNRLAADLLESPGPAFDPREGSRLPNAMDSSSWGLPPNNQGGRGPVMGGGNRPYVKSEPNSSPWSDMLAEVTTPNTMRTLLQEHGVPPQQQAQQQPHQPPSRLGREPSTSMGLPSSPKGRGISDALSPRNLGREPQSALEADLRDMSERIVLKEAADKQQGQRVRWQPNSDRFLDATTMHTSQPKVEAQPGSFMPFGDVDTLHALVLSGQAQQEANMYPADKPWSADQQAQGQQSLNPYLVQNQGQSNFQSQDSKLQVFPPQQQPGALLDNMGIPFSPTIEILLKDVSRDAESNPGLESFKSNGSFGKIDSFGKLDSFGRWMNSAADISDISQGPGSLPGQLWYPTYPEDTMGGVPQQMDEGLTPTPSLSEQLFSIVDFSPEWGFTMEDTKVIISGSFVKQPNGADTKWYCMFGTIEVPAELLGDGVLRCKAPQQNAGTVPFYITCGDRQACSEVREFEYRSPGLKLPGEMPSQPNFVTEELDTAEELLLKIRLSRMLLGLVNGRVNNRTQVFDEKDDDEWKNLEYLVHSSGKSLAEVKEQLLQTILSHKLMEWLKTKSEAEDDRGPSVLDDRGQGVPHFMAALGYDWSIQPLYARGIPPNFRDDAGWTALHWAAKCGRENTVVALLDAGVAAPNLMSYPTHQYPRGESASDLASAGGHGGIAGFLAEKSLTERLSSMTLHDDINELEKMTANLEGEKAVAQLYRRTSLVRSVRGPDDDVKLKASLNAVRVSTQTGALLQTVYRLQSFRRRAQLEPDEYGLSEVDKSNLLAARRIQQAYRGHHRKNMMRQHLAATRIQQKFRGWKGRKEYQAMRQRIIKVQAHVRGRLVRNKYRKILWSVSIVEKVVLRWLRKRPGLKGFQPARRVDGADDNEDVTKEGRQNAKEAVKQEIEKVITMVRQKSGREQYNRLLHEEQRTSASKTELQEQLDYYTASRDFME